MGTSDTLLGTPIRCSYIKPNKVCWFELFFSAWQTLYMNMNIICQYWWAFCMSAWQTCLHGKPDSLLVPACLSAPPGFSLPVQENFLSVCQGLSFCLSISPSISVHLFFCQFAWQTFYLYACLFAWQSFLPICLSVCLARLLSVRTDALCWSMYLSHFPSMGQIARRRN
jgi:hypothetical protein